MFILHQSSGCNESSACTGWRWR